MHRKTFNVAFELQRRLIDIHVVHHSAGAAHDVMVIVNIWVEPHSPRTEVDVLYLAHGAQFRQGLIHRAQRDAWHLLGCNLVQGFGCGVGRIAIQETKNELALWGDFVPLLAEAGDKLFWCLHRDEINPISC